MKMEEQLATRYLLGAATEEECVRVEERFLRDAEYLRQLRALECEIIDDYVRGEMPEAERRSFERRALASSQGREQVAIARKLQARLDQAVSEGRAASEEAEIAQPIVEARESLWEKLRAGLFAPGALLRYGLAAAASSLLLIGGAWLLREASLSRRHIALLNAELDSLRRSESNLQERLAALQSEGRQSASRLENERRRLAAERLRNDRMRREMRELQARSPASPIREDDFVELALTSGIERNSGDPRRLRIPAGARFVKLQLEIDPSIDHRSFRVELTTAGGAQVWSQGGLIAQQSEWGRFITLTLPARALQAGEYELILSGLTGGSDSKKSEVAGYYYFIASPAEARNQ